MPYSVGAAQIARQIDPYLRSAHGVMDTIKSKVPWWSETLMPVVDIFGQPVPSKQIGLLSYQKAVQNDPAIAEMKRLGVFPAKVERKIRGVTLTEQQYYDYATLAGKLTKMRLDAAVADPGWADLPDPQKADRIKHIVDDSRTGKNDGADKAVIAKYIGTPDDILRQATDAKKARLLGTPIHQE